MLWKTDYPNYVHKSTLHVSDLKQDLASCPAGQPAGPIARLHPTLHYLSSSGNQSLTRLAARLAERHKQSLLLRCVECMWGKYLLLQALQSLWRDLLVSSVLLL